MHAVYFDIETVGDLDINRWDRVEEVWISSAAAVIDTELSDGTEVQMTKIWWAGMQLADEVPASVGEIASGLDSGDLPVMGKMNRVEVAQMVTDLQEIIRGMDFIGSSPVSLFSWYGTGFDFPAMASVAPDARDEIADICRRSYDPCYYAIKKFGHPISLDKAAIGLGVSGKEEGRDGLWAAHAWPDEAGEVVRYVHQDALITRGVVRAIMDGYKIKWLSGGHKIKEKPITSWKSVRQLNELPDPNRSWMRDYDGRYDQSTITGWMN